MNRSGRVSMPRRKRTKGGKSGRGTRKSSTEGVSFNQTCDTDRAGVEASLGTALEKSERVGDDVGVQTAQATPPGSPDLSLHSGTIFFLRLAAHRIVLCHTYACIMMMMT